jgi:hypothetical protein
MYSTADAGYSYEPGLPRHFAISGAGRDVVSVPPARKFL